MTIHYEGHGVQVHAGDCLDVLRGMGDATVDSVVTDPPYSYAFMGRTWDSHPTPVAYQAWCQLWAVECLRVLKPGGHLLAFGGTRTSHRLACAIEDAGFEIRDSIASFGGTISGPFASLSWVQGQGFPKSLAPYRSIMGACPSSGLAPHAVRLSRFTPAPSNGAKAPTALALARIQPGDDPVLLIQTGAGDGSFVQTGTSLSALATTMSLSTDSLLSVLSDVVYEQKNTSTTATTSSATTVSAILKCSQSLHTQASTTQAATRPDGCLCPAFTVAESSSDCALGLRLIHVLTAPALVTARPLAPLRGYGTALRPAHEPIVVARKPLAGTVAATVLAYGTGALNIDASRIQSDDAPDGRTRHGGGSAHSDSMGGGPLDPDVRPISPAGRWPSNVVLSHNDDCGDTICAGGCPVAMLDAQSGERPGAVGMTQYGSGTSIGTTGIQRTDRSLGGEGVRDSGGASRFFPVFRYEPKAGTAERVRLPKDGPGDFNYRIHKRCSNCGRQKDSNGADCRCPEPDFVAAPVDYTAHPTTKPLDLMRWLVRLVTPPGGVVLDPFAGSGTTAEACLLEGFRCITIEREPDYLPLIVQRINRRRDPVAATKVAAGEPSLFDLLEGA